MKILYKQSGCSANEGDITYFVELFVKGETPLAHSIALSPANKSCLPKGDNSVSFFSAVF